MYYQLQPPQLMWKDAARVCTDPAYLANSLYVSFGTNVL